HTIDSVVYISYLDLNKISISCQLTTKNETTTYANNLLNNLSFMASSIVPLIESIVDVFSVDEFLPIQAIKPSNFYFR
ncbi:hypothetical protein, partial [Escherichia coli]|uniref:hypothetical protein n=1 Tax=Escherichia coli TaxID=562 RepID=UPI001BDBA308